MIKKHLIASTRPIADEKNTVLWRDYRVTVLTDRLFRLEKSANKRFRDGATQSVWYRDMPQQTFTVEEADGFLTVATPACKLIVAPDRADCRIEKDGKLIAPTNARNLSGTYRTLDCCDGDELIEFHNDRARKPLRLGTGVCSRTGVAVFDDSASLVLGADGKLEAGSVDGTDEYIFAYGNDYRGAVKALFAVTGEVPMIPRFALGNWWSRYYEYSDVEFLRLMNMFEEHDVPITVAVIDMDWHYSVNIDEQLGITASGRNTPEYIGNGRLGWTGYTWNKYLFPDYKAFLSALRERNLKVTLNLHPADGVRYWEDCYTAFAQAVGADPATQHPVCFDINDDKFINAYFDVIHKPYERDGVDFWWIDWQQGEKSSLEGCDPLWALNHYHYFDNAQNHDVPLILSRYAGVGSHRYPIGFSGDTLVTWDTLEYLPYFTATASNIGYTWWSHDIGGHMLGATENELYLRFIQYGVFSPVNRLHSSSSKTFTKEPWLYGGGCGDIAARYLRFRHRMIPYLYSAAYRTHKDGKALIEPLYYEWDTKKAYEYDREYLFGESLLVLPVTSRCKRDGFARIRAWLPGGEWTDIFTGDIYRVPDGGRKLTLYRGLEDYPVLARAGAVLPLSADKGNRSDNPHALELWIFKGDGKYVMYEDGGKSDGGNECFTECVTEYKDGVQKLTVKITGADVIPSDRTMTVRFKNIQNGTPEVACNGVKAASENILTDCTAVRFAVKRGETYTVTVAAPQVDILEELKSRASAVLTKANADNREKDDLYSKLCQATSIEEFENTAMSSKLSNAVRCRLTETISE